MLKGITRNQWLGIIIVILGVIAGGSAQLIEVVGPTVTKLMVSLATLLNTAMGGIIVILGGQNQQVIDVRRMPGVEKVLINENANQTLAAMATDPNEPKVGATDPLTRQTLIETAKGN